MKIAPEDLVLEIGSGHRPHPRSNVLVDKFIGETEERGDRLSRQGRPLVNAEGERLPFRDKTFDYVICRQVLEHSLQPELFLDEIQRVGKKGVIETPSPVWELIFTPREYHRCLIHWDEEYGRLLVKIRRGDEYSKFGRLFAYLYENDVFFRLFYDSNRQLMLTRIEWRERIYYRILEPEDQILPDLYDTQTIQRLLGPKGTLSSKRGRWAYGLFRYIYRKMKL